MTKSHAAKKPNPALAPRVRHPKSKYAAWQKLLELGPAERKSQASTLVRLSRFSPNTLDLDNFAGGAKWLIDQLRYCGLIPGDRPEEVTLEFAQIKTQHKNESGTLIEIFFTQGDPALEENGTAPAGT